MKKDLLGIAELNKAEINAILDAAAVMKTAVLRGEKPKTAFKRLLVAPLFFENSTRTKSSFERAARLLGAEVLGFDVAASSVSKGESLTDTGKTLDALGVDAAVIRHTNSGAARFLAENVSASVINAGDGTHEHPTQALLDFFTMREHFGTLSGLKVTIIGDIKHSRVARSNIAGLVKLGSEVCVCGPQTLLPAQAETLGARMFTNAEEAVADANVVMPLRLQLERQKAGLFPGTGEYFALYGVTDALLKEAARGAIVMHPGPVNRGTEISTAACDGAKSKILTQVENGVYVRMAVLNLLAAARKRRS